MARPFKENPLHESVQQIKPECPVKSNTSDERQDERNAHMRISMATILSSQMRIWPHSTAHTARPGPVCMDYGHGTCVAIVAAHTLTTPAHHRSVYNPHDPTAPAPKLPTATDAITQFRKTHTDRTCTKQVVERGCCMWRCACAPCPGLAASEKGPHPCPSTFQISVAGCFGFTGIVLPAGEFAKVSARYE